MCEKNAILYISVTSLQVLSIEKQFILISLLVGIIIVTIVQRCPTYTTFKVNVRRQKSLKWYKLTKSLDLTLFPSRHVSEQVGIFFPTHYLSVPKYLRTFPLTVLYFFDLWLKDQFPFGCLRRYLTVTVVWGPVSTKSYFYVF